MPLVKGKSRAAVSQNIRTERAAKKPQKQAVAIALKTAGLSNEDATNYQTTPATFNSPPDWNGRDVDPIGFSEPDWNQVIPNNMSDKKTTSDNAMDSIKAKSFGGVSLADFGFGRPAKDTVFNFNAPDKTGAAGASLAWGAPFQFTTSYPPMEAKQMAGGIKASGFGSSGINGKDSSFTNDACSGTDAISKLWK